MPLVGGIKLETVEAYSKWSNLVQLSVGFLSIMAYVTILVIQIRFFPIQVRKLPDSISHFVPRSQPFPLVLISVAHVNPLYYPPFSAFAIDEPAPCTGIHRRRSADCQLAASDISHTTGRPWVKPSARPCSLSANQPGTSNQPHTVATRAEAPL